LGKPPPAFPKASGALPQEHLSISFYQDHDSWKRISKLHKPTLGAGWSLLPPITLDERHVPQKGQNL